MWLMYDTSDFENLFSYDLQQWLRLRYDLIILEQCASTVSQQYKRES